MVAISRNININRRNPETVVLLVVVGRDVWWERDEGTFIYCSTGESMARKLLRLRTDDEVESWTGVHKALDTHSRPYLH